MTSRQLFLTLLVVAVAGLLGGALCEWFKGGAAYAQEPDAGEAWAEQTLGIVQNGEFHPLVPKPIPGAVVRLTAIRMQEAIAPEAGELDLTRYEGSAIMVHGRDAGGWIYSATVVDAAGPILTAVAQQVFGEQE